ncbi:MAG: PEGA domain-containing protein [Deltaproteobacteria bacterium]|nr:PEGA domain-containing protein [Deltaproteobacteria bacterium]
MVIDGTEVGPTPYEGKLGPGSHEISGTSDELGAPVQTVAIVAGETTVVVLQAGARTGKLEVRLTDEVGTIFIDGKEVGKGGFEGELPVGKHTLRVTREDYEPFEKTVEVVATDVQVETVSLKKAATGDAQAEEEEGDWTFDGFYGGLQLGAMFLPANMGHTLDAACDTTGATSCDGGTPVGATIGGFFGYAFAPLGFELLVIGGGEMVEPTAHFDGTTGSDINPLNAAPEREEEFIIGRFGGGGALRARVLVPIDRFRVTGALGAGLAYRHMILGRTVTAADGTEAETSDGGTGYLTPVLSAELSGQVRFSGSSAFVVGLNLWLEHAGNDATTEPQPDALLTGDDDQTPHPLATPAYDMATGTQLYLGPFLGIQIGP